jgi:hypothetical protein
VAVSLGMRGDMAGADSFFDVGILGLSVSGHQPHAPPVACRLCARGQGCMFGRFCGDVTPYVVLYGNILWVAFLESRSGWVPAGRAVSTQAVGLKVPDKLAFSPTGGAGRNIAVGPRPSSHGCRGLGRRHACTLHGVVMAVRELSDVPL